MESNDDRCGEPPLVELNDDRIDRPNYSPDHLTASDQSTAMEHANELVELLWVEAAVLERTLDQSAHQNSRHL